MHIIFLETIILILLLCGFHIICILDIDAKWKYRNISAVRYNNNSCIYNHCDVECTGFSVSLLCTGLLSIDVDVRIQLNISRASRVSVLDIRRKKPCLRGQR